MKKFLLMFVGAFTCATAFADPVPEGLTITPNDDGTTATVTKCEETLAGEIVIPSVATIDGKDYTVTTIGYRAFRRCASLSSIILPSTLTSLGEEAFRSAGIESIVIPDGVTQIPKNCFTSCKKMGTIEIPESVTQIGTAAFNSCKALTSIDIPAGVTQIAGRAFTSCSSLKSIALPAGITKIEPETFYFCEALESVEIPAGVTEIGDKAFYHCEALKSVDLPAGLTSIGTQAFYYSGLTSLDIPASITQISAAAFQGTELASVVIPEGVTAVGANAFGNIEPLKDITIPSTVTSIGDNAFYNNGIQDGIQRITVNAMTPPTLGTDVFTAADKNAAVIVPAAALDAYKAAAGWSEFTNLSAGISSSLGPDVMYSINEDGSSITINSWLNARGDIRIPATVTVGDLEYTVSAVAPKAFVNCTELNSVVINADLTAIPEDTFYGCTALASVTLPGSLETIGNNAFYGCTALSDIDFPSGVTSIGSEAFRKCESLTEVRLPEELTSLGASAFDGCTGLRSIVFPPRLGSIPITCCQNCPALSYVEIGAGTTEIGTLAFYKSDNIQHIKVMATTPPLIHYTAEGLAFPYAVMQKAMVTVPDGCIDTYKADQFWGGFRTYSNLSGITDAIAPGSCVTGRYSLDGRPVDSSYRGIVLTRYSDGSVTRNLVR